MGPRGRATTPTRELRKVTAKLIWVEITELQSCDAAGKVCLSQREMYIKAQRRRESKTVKLTKAE